MQERQFKTARGREEPCATQFSIFLANRVGQLKDLMQIFPQKDVDILGISIVDSSDWAVVRVIASDPDKARDLLKSHSFPFTESTVLLVEIDDSAAIAGACAALVEAELSVNFAYPLTIHSHENAVMAFHVDDHIIATQLLRSHGFTLLGDADLADSE